MTITDDEFDVGNIRQLRISKHNSIGNESDSQLPIDFRRKTAP